MDERRPTPTAVPSPASAATAGPDELSRLRAELREARDRAEEANSAKSQFLSVVGHELRTPLTAIIGYTELLESGLAGPVAAKQLEQLGRIRVSAWRLVEMINGILTFSRIEAGREQIRPEETDAVRLAREVLILILPVAAAKRLSLSERLPDGPVPLVTDPGKVRQILLRLLDNAMKFTDAGSVVLELESCPGGVAYHVRDTGPGIDPLHHDAIFEPFHQVDQSSTRAKGGTGLGLPLGRELARLLGGDIELESVPGSGSRFTLRLPSGC